MPSDELRFGTAGLRGPVRPGPGGMNVELVARATWAVGEWLRSTGYPDGTVVVGRDGRHGSAEFFSTTTGVLAAAGFDVVALPGLSPTPLVAFACRDLDAAAGIQITASHNPAADNGYKLYGGIGTDAPGAQIVAPVDAEIEALMARAPSDIPMRPVVPDARARANRERYLARLSTRFGRVDGPVRIALTALHGVGGSLAVDALRNAGCDDVRVVADQFAPDPDFPTVEFPNPEEPGATDRLLRLAADADAHLAVALDPDADRCALAIPDGDGWRQLTGDEVGGLLCSALAEPGGVVASSIVSGTLAADVAQAAGARSVRTLTGFKWLVRAGEPLVYAYEEAIGHCVVPTSVRDKDGIGAAVLAARLAARLRRDGSSIATLLDELALRHGVHATVGRSLRLPPPTTADEIMGRLRSRPRTSLASVDLTLFDYATRTDELRTDAVEFAGETDSMRVRALIRPSGTEPKVKAYVEVVAPVPSAAAVADARSKATALATRVAVALLA
ncbi:putative phosphoglucomutase [Gordonia araii NBRC 100433]|uniref:Putative phosphoglucomutase n=1 Tax=Gordonia araii NBRC 100433 TaxID=1073574 RepID=G7GYM5_9ACTN|nr:phospho-sugar mutase [Gordonia araii]GAB08700.1 putative phosphoglucomutase [Gordonia araii NBRC 100433]